MDSDIFYSFSMLEGNLEFCSWRKFNVISREFWLSFDPCNTDFKLNCNLSERYNYFSK